MDTIKAIYSSPREFIGDVVRDKEHVEGNFVRISREWRSGVAGVTRVFVVAGAIVAGRLVECRVLCGDLWGTDKDEQVSATAQENMSMLENELTEAGFELRAGSWQAVVS